MLRGLQLDEVSVRYTDEEGVPERSKDCCPGQPHITFSAKPGVVLHCHNPIPRSGLFSQSIKISDGDSYMKVVSQLIKQIRTVKGILVVFQFFV